MQYGFTYPWDDGSLRLADRLDFVARSGEFVAAGEVPVRIVAGAGDDAAAVLTPSEQLHTALTEAYADPATVDRVLVNGMEHAFADDPGDAPAPQNAAARAVDRLASDWLGRHLMTGDAATS